MTKSVTLNIEIMLYTIMKSDLRIHVISVLLLSTMILTISSILSTNIVFGTEDSGCAGYLSAHPGGSCIVTPPNGDGISGFIGCPAGFTLQIPGENTIPCIPPDHTLNPCTQM